MDSVRVFPVQSSPVRVLQHAVLTHIKNSIISQELIELQSDEHEVLWLNVRPRRLPRGFSSIIIGVVYHPPGADNESMRDYIRDCLTKIEALHPNCGIIIAGDFNKFDAKNVTRLFHLKHLINFPTRGANKLDQIFTNLSEFYADVQRLPPFGLSDHLTIVMPPKVREKSEKPAAALLYAKLRIRAFVLGLGKRRT